MKSIYQSYLMMSVVLLTALASGCALGPPSRQAQTSAANQVVDDYKVSGLLAQAGPAIVDSLGHNLPDSVTAEEKQQIDASVAKAYEPQRLRNTVVSQLSDAAAASDHQRYLIEAANTLQKPLPQRMVSLESKVADPGFGKDFQAFLDKPSTPERRQRLEIIGQLASDMVVTDLQLDFNLSLLKSVIKARNSVAESNEQVGAEQKERILSKSRTGIQAKLEEQVPRMLLYVYRDVDTKTLKEYAALQHQPAMVWTNRALADAVTAALSDAGERIPKHFNVKD